MLNSGERQVAPFIGGIRRDHVARYEWAAGLLKNASVVDLACGVGYGTRLLAERGCHAVGIDRDNESLAYADKHYKHERNSFHNIDLNSEIVVDGYDAAVCFEAIEHLEDPRPLLKSLIQSTSTLLASVPNESVFPWKNYAFHFRHYTRDEFTDLLHECGWEPVEWYGQEGPESEVEPDVNGRTLIAVCHRIDDLAAKPAPKHVAIVGLGPSVNQYVDVTKRLGGRHAYCDEVWGINALGDVLDCDIVFHMDDIRIQQIRADARPESNIANMLDWLKSYKGRIITSRGHPEYSQLEEFPLEEAINKLGYGYFNSTAAYAVAYALLIGVEKISLFGCDYTYPNAHTAERGRACVEYWLGYARAKGIIVRVPQSTTLIDAMYSQQERMYGHDTRIVTVSAGESGAARVSFEEREELPTADEIEARYDHSAHPNPLVPGKAA